MSMQNFRPEIWSRVILASLQKKLVYGPPMVVNNDCDGETAGTGDAVHIAQLGDPEISTYTPGSGPITYQNPVNAGLTLYINQAKSFSFAIDDVDRRQAAGDMQRYLEGRAAYRMADVADQFIASQYTGVAATNVLGTTGAPVTPLPYQIGGSSSGRMRSGTANRCADRPVVPDRRVEGKQPLDDPGPYPGGPGRCRVRGRARSLASR